MEINTMAIDATFWVAVSFIIFFGALIYLKIPQKITALLDKMISDIKNEIDESEKLRTEAKTLLDNAQNKLDTAQTVSNEIIEEAKKDTDKLIIELNDKFHKSSEIKKNLVSQLTAPVKWTQSMQQMIADGATHFIEVGPGNVLQGLMRKIDRSLTTSAA